MSQKQGHSGPQYWRSLAHKNNSAEYRHAAEERHHDAHSSEHTELDRRSFLTLMGASMALAGLAGCRRPVEKIVPYVDQPEVVVPGVPMHYATSMPRGNRALGLIVECHEGRPTKIEGNPAHPSSRGASDIFAQASVLDLYDPDRSAHVLNKGVRTDWTAFVQAWREIALKHENTDGDGLAVLAEPFSSPTMARLKSEFEDKYPAARWVTWEPIGDQNLEQAVRNATGRDRRVVYDYGQADVVLSLESDFLHLESESIAAARGFSDLRRVSDPKGSMNRLYVVESDLSITGGAADHRLRVHSSQIGGFAVELARELSVYGADIEAPDSVGYEADQTWLQTLAVDLMQNMGRCLVVAGRSQPAWVHELVLLINHSLNAFGRTIRLVDSTDTTFSQTAALLELVRTMDSGAISTLVMLGGDPMYNAPAELDFRGALSKVETTVHLSDNEGPDESDMTWHLPASHYLESWSDVRSIEGIPGIVQPLVAPLHGGKSDVELMGLMATGRDRRGYDIVRETWNDLLDDEFEDSWRQVLHDGLLPDAQARGRDFRPKRSAREIAADISLPPPPETGSLEVVFKPSNLYDGRYANNGWLMELPDPVSKLSWDNAALINPATAKSLGVENGDIVTLSLGERSINIPIWVLPGQSSNSVMLPLGFGRSGRGRVADGSGVSAYPLRTSANPYIAVGASITRTGQRRSLANVQDHSVTEGRAIVLEASLKEYRGVPEIFDYMSAKEHYPNMYEPHDYSKGYQWGMTIDLTLCTGCGACTVACQGENNIPVVGRDAVERGREMHWIRVDRYFRGDEHDPRIVQMPMPCQQCENAPCESVCPVAATVHDSEGLNTMNYNRCIGTRYCSNNCPYKVRRFNFFHYTGDMPELLKMVQNPDVTVRSRGVMEKCTYCLQRLTRAKYRAKDEGRDLRNGEVQTACQQACPTQAIHFGVINDKDSQVARDKEQKRNYELLGELNVRPRTSYLGKLRNPNPELEGYKPEQA